MAGEETKNSKAERRRARREQRAKRAQAARSERKRAALVKAKKRRAAVNAVKKKLRNLPGGFGYKNSGILPRVELTVRGDGTSVAARLAAAGITVKDMSCSGGVVRCKIRKKDMRKAIAILEQMCYNYRISGNYGAGALCSFLLSRIGLSLGFLAFAAGLHLSYGRIWRISISGSDRVPVSVIERALSAQGISIGCSKRALSQGRVTKALRAAKGIADASCTVSGTTLYVRVLESDDHAERVPSKLVRSCCDAVVTRIVLRSGSAQVAVGDVVRGGDLLVSGQVYSTAGELLYTEECDADVYGSVSMALCVQIPAVAVEYRRTGRAEKRTVFSLFGRSMGSAKPPFGSCETTAHTARYDVLLPLYVTTYTFFETAPVECERDIEGAVAAFAEQKRQELCFSGDFTHTYTYTRSPEGLYSVHLFFSGEALISRGAEV